MVKPEPPTWLKDGFWLAAGELAGDRSRRKLPPCWLADHDPRRRRCKGRLQACHLINAQRIRNTLVPRLLDLDAQTHSPGLLAEVIVQAEMDPRLAVPGCEVHHPAFDHHSVGLPRHQLVVPRAALPEPFLEYCAEYELEVELDRCYPTPPDPIDLEAENARRREHGDPLLEPNP